MKLVYALIVIFWWIAIWGLTDELVEDMTKQNRIKVYLGIIAVIAAILYFFPHILDWF
jgi:hypothetical protein